MYNKRKHCTGINVWLRLLAIAVFTLSGGLFLGSPITKAATAPKAMAVSTCTNSVAAGVYWDANGDGVHEPNEPFLAGTVNVLRGSDIIISLQSPDGLFTLQDLPCAEYTVYHNGDYVGKLVVAEAMGSVLIELPKKNRNQSLFIPIVLS